MEKNVLSRFAKRVKQEIKRQQMQKIFTGIYVANKWKDAESRSGPGSNRASTVTLRAELPVILRHLGVRSMLDIPCGDFAWMQAVELPVERYIGADIVQEATYRNSASYGRQDRDFVCLDVTKDPLPPVDLIFCRDCLVHLPLKDISLALRNIKASKSKFIALTTFTESNENVDIVAPGEWRKLNLMLTPFSFPEPLMILNERYAPAADKCIAIWRISDIPDH